MNLRTAAVLVVLGLALTACGGGGGGGGGDTAGATTGTGANGALDGSTFASVEAFIAFMRQLVATAADTGEPLALPDGAAPTTDTTEPAA